MAILRCFVVHFVLTYVLFSQYIILITNSKQKYKFIHLNVQVYDIAVK